MRSTLLVATAALVLVAAEEPSAADREAAEKTRFFWEAGRKVKVEFAKNFQALALPSVQASKVSELANKAAQELRDLEHDGVDEDVIDHVNNVIRHYENMAMTARRDGVRSIARTAIRAYLQAHEEEGKAPPPTTSDITAGVLKLLNNDETARSLKKIQDDEQALIKAMRKKYGVKLAPW
jgi:hypothetical protein